MPSWLGFLWPFAAGWVIVYGIVGSLLLAPLRTGLAVRLWQWVSRPVVRGMWTRDRRLKVVQKRAGRALFWLSGLYCPICVGTWVLGAIGAVTTWALGSWTPMEFAAWWTLSVMALIVSSSLGWMPVADGEAERALGLIREGTNEIVQGEA